MYYLAIRQFVHSLKTLDAILVKAQRHAEARKFDVNNLCSARLFPDMLPFVAQIRIACDIAKTAAANLSSREAPRHEDNEKTFEDLHARIAKCLQFLESLTPADFERTGHHTIVKIPNPPGKALHADDYLVARAIPNFYFHMATAYGLLRASGIELGKADYLGALPLVDPS
jgi:hypothetical protein